MVLGLVPGPETTLVALTVPDQLRGSGYGLLGLVQSFGDLGASLVVGLLWSLVSPTLVFGYAAAWMGAAALAAVLLRGGRSALPAGG